jgi:cobalt-precorrin 5A hydrolase
VVNEKPVALVQECGEKNWWTRPSPLPKSIRVFSSIAEAKAAGDFDAWLVVSDRAAAVLETELGDSAKKCVIYRPKTLCLGMGCDAGTGLPEVQELVESSLAELGLSSKSLKSLSSIDLKSNEEALHQLAKHYNLELKFYTRDELNARGVKSEANPVVEKYTGAIGVCEPSAMLSAGSSDLVAMKRKSKRATLAVARMGF